MAVIQPYFRTCRQFADGHYAHSGKAKYIEDRRFAQDGEHYVRALTLIQKDLLDLFDFIEPDDANAQTYSYRTHALLMRTAIEVEANCKAILSENGYVRGDPDFWNMGDYKKLEGTHRLSAYEVMLPVWKGATNTRQPFKQWATKALPWWKAYNDSKHNRHDNFSEASFTNLIDAVCALVAILSAQFHTNDLSPGGYLLLAGGGTPPGYEKAIGGYFLVKFPSWPTAEQYDFQWNSAMNFQQHTF